MTIVASPSPRSSPVTNWYVLEGTPQLPAVQDELKIFRSRSSSVEPRVDGSRGPASLTSPALVRGKLEVRRSVRRCRPAPPAECDSGRECQQRPPHDPVGAQTRPPAQCSRFAAFVHHTGIGPTALSGTPAGSPTSRSRSSTPSPDDDFHANEDTQSLAYVQTCANTSDQPDRLTLTESHSIHRL
jgi:hypothetical protein